MAGRPKERKNKNVKKKREFKMRYSFLTVVLLLCLVHVGVSAFYNITKTMNYQVKIRKMEQLKEQASQDNIKLKEELENFNSLESLEAIARNNLKMAGEDEVLVIINKKNEEKAETQPVQNLQPQTKKSYFPKRIKNRD